jgi:lysine 6-dehydrogenase
MEQELKRQELKMKVAVVGVGRMGTAISWGLDKLSTLAQYADIDELTLADVDADNVKRCSQNISCPTLEVEVQFETRRWDHCGAFLKNNDIVISALPYHQNEIVARYCIDNHIPYCDLGGHVETSSNINKYASQKGSVVMTDLGLAPGWVNILAEHGYQSYCGGELHGARPVPDTIEMMVGGLPVKPNNYLKYSCTWSGDGLVNEYKDQCEVLINGRSTLVDGMSGLTEIETRLGPVEAFYTSGGASHTIKTMLDRGVQNCGYKTIRYLGHCSALQFLINDCGLTNDALASILQHSCPPADDLVIIKARAGGHEGIADWSTEKVIHCNDKFSAMQMATAFPVATVATMMTNKDRDELGTEPLSYRDIARSYEEFEDSLDFLFRAIK